MKFMVKYTPSDDSSLNIIFGQLAVDAGLPARRRFRPCRAADERYDLFYLIRRYYLHIAAACRFRAHYFSLMLQLAALRAAALIYSRRLVFILLLLHRSLSRHKRQR